MMGYTHAAAGALVGAAVGHCFGASVFGALFGALTGLMPDIDHPGSIIGSKVRPASIAIEMIAGHRTITHTVWFCLAMGLAAAWLGRMASVLAENLAVHAVKMPFLFGGLARLVVPPWLWACLALVGGASHLVLDGMTRSGIEPFMPVSEISIKGPVRTGSVLIELPLAVVFLIATWHLVAI